MPSVYKGPDFTSQYKNQLTEVYTNVNSNSATWTSGTDITEVAAASSGWNNTQTTVQNNSATWSSLATVLSTNEIDTVISRGIVHIGTHTAPICSMHSNEFHYEPQSVAPTWEEGTLYYDQDNYTLTMQSDISTANLQIGQENWVRVANKTGGQIDNGTIVYILSAGPGVKGAIPLIDKAIASDQAIARRTLGIATHDIINDGEGFVTTFGLVRDLNTEGIPEGSLVYLSPTTAGAYTSADPSAPNATVAIGQIVQTHATDGIIFCNPQKGRGLNQLNDVYYDAATLQNGDMLQWNSLSSRWEAVSSISMSGVPSFENGIIIGGVSGIGIKLDTTGETFGWRDITSDIVVKGPAGGTTPSYNNFITNINAYQFTVNDECWINFHIPHDYVPNSDIYMHTHWAVGTNRTGGTYAWAFDSTYASRNDNNMAVFPATVQKIATHNATTHPVSANGHVVSEVQLTDGTGKLGGSNIEVDGIILSRVSLSANPAGASTNEPFLFFVDLHYQSTNLATKNRAPNFYGT